MLGFLKKKKISMQKMNTIDFVDEVMSTIKAFTANLSPTDSLRILFEIENRIYQLQGQESIRYGNGIHTKHKHLKYHDFFIENIPPYSKVLDIGCGNGALTFDISKKVNNVTIYGIDCIKNNIEYAEKHFKADNITYVCGDALKDLPNMTFNVIIMSNVLEHIEHRVEFLKKLKRVYNPQKILLRVPIFERDWRVPLKEELGIDYRLDQTHFIEYRQDEFWKEIKEAGLEVDHFVVQWGEIWAEVC